MIVRLIERDKEYLAQLFEERLYNLGDLYLNGKININEILVEFLLILELSNKLGIPFKRIHEGVKYLGSCIEKKGVR
ncbi:MAG: hypothetical protein DRJ67_06360 [Thermoprotei archaeon]|nr:MAG: hypothetical protein DRJ67_06360 [Thermoprotei archaeon]